MPRDPITRLREVCLSLPEAHEVEAWGTPTFRVRNKIFAMYANDHHGDGRAAVWCKATPADQDLLVHGFPDRFFVPPYVGARGWVGVRLDRSVRWTMVRELITEAYRMTAPKRLLALLEGG